MPKVSVIMSTYKEKSNDLCAAIESILSQTFDDFEFLITLDNPENEELKKILKYYENRDKRITLFFNDKNIGLAKSLNNMLNASQAKVVARMDADDIAMPERFQKEYSFLIEHPEYKVVSVNKMNIDEDGNIISHGGQLPKTAEKIKRKLQYINMILHPGVMFDREFILKLKGYRDIVPAEDHDLWLRVINAGGKIGLLDEYLMKYRTSSANISSSASLRMWYTDKYVKTINRNGGHTIQKERLEEYLERKGCYDKRRQIRFAKANKLFYKARAAVVNKKYLEAIVLCCTSIVTSPQIADMIINSILYKIV